MLVDELDGFWEVLWDYHDIMLYLSGARRPDSTEIEGHFQAIDYR